MFSLHTGHSSSEADMSKPSAVLSVCLSTGSQISSDTFTFRLYRLNAVQLPYGPPKEGVYSVCFSCFLFMMINIEPV